VLFTMVDTAMGAATYDYLQPYQLCASIEVQLRFLKAATPGGQLRADVRVVQAGRRIVQLAAEVTDSTGRLVATATGSFAIFPAESGS
jgi:acyl-CoA thioesterase